MATILGYAAYWLSGTRQQAAVDSGRQLESCGYIPIDARAQCIDLTGAEYAGGVRWERLFDESLEPCTENPVKTDPLPQFGHGSFFPEGFGLQVVIDLKEIYQLESIWYYPRSFESDTLWIYEGDYINKKLVQICFIDGIPDHWGWKKIKISAQTRWITLRFNSHKAAVAECRFFGSRISKSNPQNAVKQGDKEIYTKNKLHQFMGTNAYDVEAPDSIMRVFGTVRQYHFYHNWEDYFKIIDNNSYDLGIQSFISVTKNGIYRDRQLKWASVRGNSRRLQAAGFDIQYPPVDSKTANSFDIKSYVNHGSLMHRMAAARKGQWDNYWENGNEEDGSWRKHYWTPYQYFLVSSADWDGHEGALGSRVGIRSADPGARLVMSGLVGLDTQRVRALQFLCKRLRRDQAFIWQGGVQYHHYSNDAKIGTLPTQALSPERDSMRKKLAAVARFHQGTIGSSIPLILGENGYDRNPASWQSAPALSGLSAAEAQGVFTVRSLMACFFSGFDRYLYFMLRNASAEENPPGVFGSSGMISGPGGANQVYPVWHYWRHIYDLLGDFQPDTVITEQGQVWVYRLKMNGPQKKRWVYYLVNSGDQGTLRFSLSTPFVRATRAMELPWFYENSQAPKPRTWTVVNGQVQLEIGAVPVFLEFQE